MGHARTYSTSNLVHVQMVLFRCGIGTSGNSVVTLQDVISESEMMDGLWKWSVTDKPGIQDK